MPPTPVHKRQPTADAIVQDQRRKVLRSEDLFADTNVIVIQHNDYSYTLRKTRHGKLILTK